MEETWVLPARGGCVARREFLPLPGPPLSHPEKGGARQENDTLLTLI